MNNFIRCIYWQILYGKIPIKFVRSYWVNVSSCPGICVSVKELSRFIGPYINE